jgi:hypothetical protein
MAASVAFAGPGNLIKFSTDTSYGTTLGQVRDIKGPEQTAEFDDITNQSSPAVGGGRPFKEWIPTLIDGGVVTFPLVYNPNDATQNDALGFLQQGTLVNWEVVIVNSGKAWFWAGYVQKFGGNWPYSKADTIDIEIKVNGPVTVGSAI